MEALYVAVWLVATHLDEQKIRNYGSAVCSGLAGGHWRKKTINT